MEAATDAVDDRAVLDAIAQDRVADVANDVRKDTKDAPNQEGGKNPDKRESCQLAPGVPEGWEEYPVMDGKYRIYVPSSSTTVARNIQCT